MKNNSTETIYRCLAESFWTERKCRTCQRPFTATDYQQNNYYLTFTEVLSVWEHPEFPLPLDNACLEVTTRLFHRHCQLFKSYPLQECQVETIKDTVLNHD